MTRDFFLTNARRGDRRFLAQTDLALEDLTDGVQRVERELCFVARIEDDSLLQRAVRVEKQEERELFLTPIGADKIARIRIRRSTVDGKTEDVLTFKSRHKTEQFNKESSTVAPEGLFELFETLPGVKRNEKTRHVFPGDEATGEVWEVDVYPTADGSMARWCKIDFEFKGDVNRALPPFPPGLVDVIDTKTPNKEDREFVDELFRNVFFRQNANVPS